MVLLNLPHSDPKANVWTRKNGKISLVVQSGYRSNPKTGETEAVGIPYGATARLLLFYLMSEAVKNKSPRVHLGRSFAAFLEAIGAAGNGGGKKSGRVSVYKQLHRLLTASFSINFFDESAKAGFFAGQNAHFVSKFELWFSKNRPQEDQIFESYVNLSSDVFESLKKSAVPLDWDILIQLRKSPLALDLYAWLTYESARAQKSGAGRFVPWHSLKAQMGSE